MANLIQTETAVKTSILSSEDGEKTFSITKEVEGIEGGHAYFILLYPTRTAENSYIEDSTNNHLLSHMDEFYHLRMERKHSVLPKKWRALRGARLFHPAVSNQNGGEQLYRGFYQ